MDPFAGLIVQHDSPDEKEAARRLRQIKRKLRTKICNEYDDLPVKIVQSIFKENFTILSEKYKTEIRLEMKKTPVKASFMRRISNFFHKKKDPPGIVALNQELCQKFEEAIENWKSGNKRRLSSLFSPKKVVEVPKKDEPIQTTCFEENWRKSVADESFLMRPTSISALSSPVTFGRHHIEKEAAKIINKMSEDPALMREVMINLPDEAFTYLKEMKSECLSGSQVDK